MRPVLLPVLILFVLSCHDSKETKGKEDELEIYPVASFFRDEISEVDSLKLPTVRFTTVDNKRDTTLISIEEFKTMAEEFLLSDISDPALRKHYKESSFADQSVPSITFSYTTRDENVDVKRLDIILKPDPVSSDKIKTVYIEKLQKHKDTLISKKLYWKSRQNFQIITSSRLAKQPEKITQVKVSWNGLD